MGKFRKILGLLKTRLDLAPDLDELLALEYFEAESCSVGPHPKKVWTIRPNKEVVVMRLNKQLPINTIQQQIKIHLKIQVEAQIARERMVVQTY